MILSPAIHKSKLIDYQHVLVSTASSILYICILLAATFCSQAESGISSSNSPTSARQTAYRKFAGNNNDSNSKHNQDYQHNHDHHQSHHHHHHHHNQQHHQHRHHSNHAQTNRYSRAIFWATDGSRSPNSSLPHYANQNISPANIYGYQSDQPLVLDQCCACDEAKYELVFEGLWSRYTHPDEFPENYWLAHFSDIIGASHSNEFRMWNNDSLATEGVKELAENGSTKKLEFELKQMSSKTRTIIKARELRYPTLNSKTSAVFRTDRQHHLVSILSKLGPSPDWMVGVSSLELCQADCSWTTQRVVNLFLWDAGTDSGTSFLSPDSPTKPQDRIHPFRRIPQIEQAASTTTTTQRPVLDYGASYDSYYYARRAMFEQPVYQANDVPMGPNVGFDPTFRTDHQKPFARLTVTRQRIYEKSCNGEPMANPPATKLSSYQSGGSFNSESLLEPTKSSSYSDCRFTDWSDWSTCSSTCGRGIRTRTRAFMDDKAQTAGCSQIDLIEKEICLSECIGNATCVTRDWSEWSKCSVNCGQGHRKRTRSPIGPMKRACASVELAQLEPCTGARDENCPAEPSSCDVTDWSQWSECSVACGKGTRIRTRQYIRKDNVERCSAKLIQKQSCTGRSELCRQQQSSKDACSMPVDPGPCRAHIERWHFVESSGMCVKFIYGGCLGNSNNFECFQDCRRIATLAGPQPPKSNPNLPVIDCKLSAWSPWSTCSALCGNGRRSRSRYIIQMPQNGGKPCDKKLSRTQKCKDLPPCPPDFEQQQHVTLKPMTLKAGGGHGNGKANRNNNIVNANNSHGWRTITTTTAASSMMDDEDDTEEIQKPETEPCKYNEWSSWSECEVVCQPVKKGSNKIRQRVPLEGQGDQCKVLEELYYCDPNSYC